MDLHVPTRPVRFVTAASLFDGHDAAINVMRRILQSQGAEVVHLGHDRSVDAVVTAAVQEDVQGVALSSYQGGHVEYFTYLKERLAEVGAGHVQVFGGGGGVIVADEIALLAERGVKIFAPEDGQRLGLAGMINELVRSCDVDLAASGPDVEQLLAGDPAALARAITVLEDGRDPQLATAVREAAAQRSTPVLGITGTGGSGKSSLTDELVRRFRLDQQDKLRIAVLAVDPTRRKGGGALLGDRIRMNAIDDADPSQVFFRSLATRRADGQLPEHLDDVIAACRAAGYDLVVVETPGIGQGDAAIVPFCDVSLYVMTPEYGAASQLREDRHARLRRRRGGEQVRAPRRRGRPTRRRPPAGARPGGVRRVLAGHAGVRHERRPLRRRRRHGAVPGAAGAAGRSGTGRVDRCAAARRRPCLDRAHERAAAVLGHLPRRRRDRRPHPPRADRPAGRGRAHASAPADGARGAHRGERRAGRRGQRRRGAPRRLDGCGPRRLAGHRGAVLRRRAGLRRAREGVPHAAAPGVAVRDEGAARRAATHPRRRRAGAFSCARRACRGRSRSPQGCSRSSARGRRRRACSPARATPSAPTAASRS